MLIVILALQNRRATEAEDRVRNLEKLLAAKEKQLSKAVQERKSYSERLDEYLKSSRESRITAENKSSASKSEEDIKVDAIKDVLLRLPEQSIPELKLAKLSDWYAAVEGRLETTEDFRSALGKLRYLAEARFAQGLQPALRDYLRANVGSFPSDTQELLPFVGGEIDAAMLQRYRVVPSKSKEYVEIHGGASVGGDWAITQASLIDSEYDSSWFIGPLGIGSLSNRKSEPRPMGPTATGGLPRP